MPYRIVKRGRKYAIVNRRTGETVGHSLSKRKAAASARIRQAAHRGK